MKSIIMIEKDSSPTEWSHYNTIQYLISHQPQVIPALMKDCLTASAAAITSAQQEEW